MKRIAIVLLLTAAAFAQQGERAIMAREATLYLNPDKNSPKLNTTQRGREVAIMETSRDYYKVLADVGLGRNITGWVQSKGVIRTSTPNGDAILFGEAVDSEDQASRRGGRKDADKDALRLYYRMAEYFPKSPLAGEALWRAADIRWQVEKAEAKSLPSARERDPFLHRQIEEEWMKEVQKKYPNTKWADLAAYSRLDNKLCGEWQGLPKCPEDESEMYEKYAKEHPNSPKAPEALYEAAWRQAALVEIYKQRGESADKQNKARDNAKRLAQQILSQYADKGGDWAARAQRTLYMVEQGIPLFGNVVD